MSIVMNMEFRGHYTKLSPLDFVPRFIGGNYGESSGDTIPNSRP